MAEASTLEHLLRRDRLVTSAGLAVLCVLAWFYILTGAGLGMDAWEMARLTLFPHQQAAGMAMEPGSMGGMPAAPGGTAWTGGTWALTIAMWWIMMVAMMSPSAAPAVLLYARVYRHALAQGGDGGRLAPTGAFGMGYALVWLAFSIAATALQHLLEAEAAISAATLGSRSAYLSAAVLVLAGVYQLSPLKHACLSHCRAPAAFLSRHWRPGAAGALRLGMLHGVYCVGCCWMLMALLFIGGVMNLAWIALLAALVLVEKLLPGGPWLGKATGVTLILWGIATLLV